SLFAFGTPPLGPHFLIRNSLIAALSIGLLVVEAPLRSGSLNTAHTATDIGRDVFVVPGTIDRTGFEGSHALLREGATFVTHPDQVLDALGIAAGPAVKPSKASGPAAVILGALGADAIPIEKIVELTGLGASEVLTEMTMLELDGRIVRGGGGYALRL
ncbi:MAG: DNA-protecting protein DprA, partial [Armatimonadota bacterium]